MEKYLNRQHTPRKEKKIRSKKGQKFVYPSRFSKNIHVARDNEYLNVGSKKNLANLEIYLYSNIHHYFRLVVLVLIMPLSKTNITIRKQEYIF